MDVVLNTERLVLRPPRPGDAESVARHLSNFAVAGNLVRVPFPYTIQDARAWLARQQLDAPPGQTGFAISRNGDDYIGQVGFHPEPEGIMIGYWLAEPYWGQGIMTEAAATAIAWYFDVTGAPILRSGVFDFNAASLAVQRKLGFVETGTSVRRCLARNADVRHIDTELTRARWAERQA